MKWFCLAMISLMLNCGLASADDSKFVEHHFKKGETLWFISLVYYGHGGEFPKIVEANHFLSAETLKEGDVLRIPNTTWNPETAEFKTHYQEKWVTHQARLKQEKPGFVVATTETVRPAVEAHAKVSVHKKEAETPLVANISNRPAPEHPTMKVSESSTEPATVLVVPIPASPLIPAGTDVKSGSSGSVGHRSASDNN